MVMLAGLTVALGFDRARSAFAAESAADRYVACLNGSKQGDLLILIDTSASLQSSDAEAARIRAGEFLLRRLAKSAEDGQLNLNVSLAGFANRYEPGGQWSQLNAGSVERVLGDIRSYRQRNTGQGTDYWLGVDGARRALSERKQAAPGSCQSIVFFSDGALDIDRAPDEDSNPIDRPYDPENRLRNNADRDRAKAAATESMCRPGGLADQTRVVPITMFGVGLTAGGAAASDFDLMRRLVEGGCGQEPGNGQFALANDIDTLLQAFDRITGSGQQQEGGFCKGDQAQLCEEGAHSFVLDASISSVAVLGSGDIEEPRIVLVSPTDRQVELKQATIGEPQTLDVDGVRLSYTWMSKKTFSATLDSAGRDESWTGRWQLIFFDPKGTNPQARSRTSIHISGNVFPTWPGADKAEIRAGETAEVTFGLEDANKQVIDPTKLLGTASLDATLIDADGKETPIAKGLPRDQITTAQKLDASKLKPGPASVRLALNVTTAGWRDPRTGQDIPGTALKPQLSDIPFTVVAPAGFGSVDPAVSFGSSDGPINLNGVLNVTGPGCVWLDTTVAPTIRTSPDQVTSISLTSPADSAQNCMRVEAGATQQMPLTLTSPQTGTGGLTGDFVVRMSSLDAPDKVQDFTVGYAAEVRRPLNRANFVITLIAALVLGPGIPLLLLYGAKRVTAKIPARSLHVEMIPVQVKGHLTRDGAPFALRDSDLVTMAQISSGGSRRVDLGGVALVARTGKSPFGSGDVRVEAGQQVGLSSAFEQPVGKRHQARLPLAVHNNWVLLHDPAGAPDAGTVILLVEGTSGPEERRKLVDDLNRRGPQLFAQLRGLGAPAGSGPGHSGPSGPMNPFGGQGIPQQGSSPFGGPGPAPGPFGGPPQGPPPGAPRGPFG